MTKSKLVLVTGGSRGLGKDMALRIAQKGHDVLLTYHSKKDEAEAVVQEIEATGQKAAALPLDVGDIGSFEVFIEQVGQALQTVFGASKIDFLVNNAGVGLYVPYAATTEEQFDMLMNIHFKGPFFLTQKLLPTLADGGGIINISSGLARFSNPGSSAYGAMKSAMETLTRYQAKELGERGIRSNIVAPGAIETDFGGGRVRDNAQLNAQIASVTALGRVGVPEDIGGVVAFLCSDDARWINAQRIEVSGGMNL
ncbi:SDR family NAD(P)-dependent oxidoreductase [Salmonirosea aquatica]|uniref:SDR family oxidoreductase n=1 Tax=Salmonirosea aquatica TaxID=2654236 RepID=A0A7C9BDU4_9BACT|nr:SDR family oxidoreductase [Cytophagaceae bacterium SJW1-29]